jgi:hypothetical protein
MHVKLAKRKCPKKEFNANGSRSEAVLAKKNNIYDPYLQYHLAPLLLPHIWVEHCWVLY